MTEQRPSKERFKLNPIVEAADIADSFIKYAYEQGMHEVGIDPIAVLMGEIERLRAALTGIQSCSTCEACRGAATLALGVTCDHDPMSQGSTLECDTRGALICKHCDEFDRSHAWSAQPPIVVPKDCPACGKPLSEHKGDSKRDAVLWCP